MPTKTKIGWSNYTWSMVTGCTKCGRECENCYAWGMTEEFQHRFNKYRNNHQVTTHPYVLDEDLSQIPAGSKIFINSMSDTFHDDVPLEFIQRIFQRAGDNPDLVFVLLTKRSERMLQLSSQLNWHDNIWAGVTVGCNQSLFRVDHLLKVPAKTRILSIEPMLEPLPDLSLACIDWAIVGGESGSDARPFDPDWARTIRDNGYWEGTAFFMKQMGNHWAKQNRASNWKGKDMNEWPQDLQIQEFPE